MFESLESRLLRSATLDTTTGLLSVVGRDKVDHISFSKTTVNGKNKLRLDFNGSTSLYTASLVKRINIEGLSGADTIILGNISKSVVVNGGKGNDTISGGDGTDTLNGQGGADKIFGSDGRDLINGGLQKDNLSGGSGNDTFVDDDGTTGDETINGGSGEDTVDYSTLAVPVSITETNTILIGVETIIGTPFADSITNQTVGGVTLLGGAGNDTLTGGAVDDRLDGGNDADSLVGGTGDDTLHGGSGTDTLSGGDGIDVFGAQDGEIDSLDGGNGVDVLQDFDSRIVKDTLTNFP